MQERFKQGHTFIYRHVITMSFQQDIYSILKFTNTELVYLHVHVHPGT